jgi:hypothetical protein
VNIFTYPVRETAETIVFTLVPIEGEANMFINPGILPKDNENFYYRATTNSAKRIIVEQRDISGMGLKNSNIFVKVQCPHACKYVLKAFKPQDDVLDLHTGYSEIGVISGDKVRSHFLSARHYSGLRIEKRYTIKLQLFSGDADL